MPKPLAGEHLQESFVDAVIIDITDIAMLIFVNKNGTRIFATHFFPVFKIFIRPIVLFLLCLSFGDVFCVSVIAL